MTEPVIVDDVGKTMEYEKLKSKLQITIEALDKIANITFHTNYTLSKQVANEEIETIHKEVTQVLERIKEC